MTLSLGTGDPPKQANRLRSALVSYYYTDPAEREPALDRGQRSLKAHLAKQHGDPTPPKKPGSGKVTRGQQSASNWALTLTQELNALIKLNVSGLTAELILQGMSVWKETALSGAALKKEALDTAARAAAVTDAGQVMELVSQANGLELAFALDFDIDLESHSETIELISMVTTALAGPIYEIKRKLDVLRPHRVGGVNFEPLIAVPGHASFPNGHAAAAFAIAHVLKDVTSANANDEGRLDAIADRLAQNRIDAGLHTDSDTKAGKALGVAFGTWLASSSLRVASPGWADLYAQAKKEW